MWPDTAFTIMPLGLQSGFDTNQSIQYFITLMQPKSAYLVVWPYALLVELFRSHCDEQV